ncbi:disulfide bond formation protein DsbC [Thiomicrospira sp. WB1]|nr:disulfide bond formation protein DsbC [Thiomicrospira sp. WB1]
MRFGMAAFVLLGLLASSAASANDKEAAQARIEQTLNTLIPNAPEAQITQTPVDGVWQVLIGSEIIYMSADGQYFFNGSLISLSTRENLTEKALNAQRREALSELSAESMIVYPAKGESQHEITVFTDVDCPYCRKLHREIPALNDAGVTVRYLAYARQGMQSEAFAKSEKIWCAKNPAKAMDRAMSDQSIDTLAQKESCEPPVRAHMQQAQQFGVQGTPTIILDDGRRFPGFVPTDELLPLLGLGD